MTVRPLLRGTHRQHSGNIVADIPRRKDQEFTKATIRIALVHRYPIVLTGLSKIFSGSERYEIVGTGTSLAEARRIVVEQTPDILICDFDLQTISVEDLGSVSRGGGATKIILLVNELSIEITAKVIETGVRGVLLKNDSEQQILDAAETVHDGNLSISGQYASRTIQSLLNAVRQRTEGALEPLTTRETQILDHLKCAKTNKEIADSVSISEKTVKRYVSSLMRKFSARNRVELAVRAQARMSEFR